MQGKEISVHCLLFTCCTITSDVWLTLECLNCLALFILPALPRSFSSGKAEADVTAAGFHLCDSYMVCMFVLLLRGTKIHFGQA